MLRAREVRTRLQRISNEATFYFDSSVGYFFRLSAPYLTSFGGRWTPQTSRQTTRSANRAPCSICTTCSTKTLAGTSARPSTRRERTGTRLGSTWSVSLTRLCHLHFYFRLGLMISMLTFCCDSCPGVGGNHQQHSDRHRFGAQHALCGDGEALPIHPVVQRWIYGNDFAQFKDQVLQKCELILDICVSQYGKGELKFSSLTFTDSGMYQCIAENYWGIKYANAELRVIGRNTELRRIPRCSFESDGNS